MRMSASRCCCGFIPPDPHEPSLARFGTFTEISTANTCSTFYKPQVFLDAGQTWAKSTLLFSNEDPYPYYVSRGITTWNEFSYSSITSARLQGSLLLRLTDAPDGFWFPGPLFVELAEDLIVKFAFFKLFNPAGTPGMVDPAQEIAGFPSVMVHNPCISSPNLDGTTSANAPWFPILEANLTTPRSIVIPKDFNVRADPINSQADPFVVWDIDIDVSADVLEIWKGSPTDLNNQWIGLQWWFEPTYEGDVFTNPINGQLTNVYPRVEVPYENSTVNAVQDLASGMQVNIVGDYVQPS